MFCSAVDGVEKSVPDPEVDELENRPVGDRLQRSRRDVIRHARAVAEEVGEPGRLHDPDEGYVKNSAGNWDGHIGPGDDCSGLKRLEAGSLVVDALDEFGIGEGRRELLAAVHFADELDLFSW